MRPFLRGSCPPVFSVPVSADNNGLSGGFLASRLCIQKFRSRRLNFRTAIDQPTLGSSAETRAWSSVRTLLRVQSEGFELSAPFRGSVAESLDANAARQTTFDRGFGEIRCEKRE